MDYTTEKHVEASSIAGDDASDDGLRLPTPAKKSDKKKRQNSESDTDFYAESESESEAEQDNALDPMNLEQELGNTQRTGTTATTKQSLYKNTSAGASNNISSKPSQFPTVTFRAQPQPGSNKPQPTQPQPTSNKPLPPPQPKKSQNMNRAVLATSNNPTGLSGDFINVGPVVKPFKRVHLPIRSPLEPTYGCTNHLCHACCKPHITGACELKAAGVEHCGLCGLAHFGHSRTCPHIKSETQVREMLLALKSSPEKKELVELATKYLRGVKGTLVQQKKRDREKAEAIAKGQTPPNNHPPMNSTAGRVPQGYGIPQPPRDTQGIPSGRQSGSHALPQFQNGQGQPMPSQRHQQQQVALQMQAQGNLNEREMENALRGFLGSTTGRPYDSHAFPK